MVAFCRGLSRSQPGAWMDPPSVIQILDLLLDQRNLQVFLFPWKVHGPKWIFLVILLEVPEHSGVEVWQTQ